MVFEFTTKLEGNFTILHLFKLTLTVLDADLLVAWKYTHLPKK